MDKIYSARDVANVVAKVEELASLNAKLEYLVAHGSNDEKLVDKKRELESSIRNYKPSFPNFNPTGASKDVEDKEIALLKKDFDSVILRFKKRKIDLETIIRDYTNGNAD